MTKSVTTWSDAPNGQQCGLHDNGDNGVRNEFTAVQDAFETTCSVSRNIALAWLRIGLGFRVRVRDLRVRVKVLGFPVLSLALTREQANANIGSDDGTNEPWLTPNSLSAMLQHVHFSVVTAFSQSTQLSVFTVTKGLALRQRVKPGPFPLDQLLTALVATAVAPLLLARRYVCKPKTATLHIGGDSERIHPKRAACAASNSKETGPA